MRSSLGLALSASLCAGLWACGGVTNSDWTAALRQIGPGQVGIELVFTEPGEFAPFWLSEPPERLEFGRAFSAEARLAWDAALEPAALDLAPWADFQPLELESQRAARGHQRFERRRFLLRAAALGSRPLGALEFAARAEGGQPPPAARSPAFQVEVSSALPAGGESVPEGALAERLEWPELPPAPRRPRRWPAVLLIALGVGAVALRWLARRTPAASVDDPLARAQRTLRELQREAQALGPVGASDALVACLRGYLEHSRGWPADRRTTPELANLAQALPAARRSALLQALEGADGLRFSSGEALGVDFERAWIAAQEFLQLEQEPRP